MSDAPTRDEMERALAGGDEGFLRGTVRRCRYCREPVYGGPTVCVPCADVAWVIEQIDRAAPAEVYVTTKEQRERPGARWAVRYRYDDGEACVVTSDRLRALAREVLVLRAYRAAVTGAAPKRGGRE
jgi:hypothetical protein